jgi:hypothetical protein
LVLGGVKIENGQSANTNVVAAHNREASARERVREAMEHVVERRLIESVSLRFKYIVIGLCLFDEVGAVSFDADRKLSFSAGRGASLSFPVWSLLLQQLRIFI